MIEILTAYSQVLYGTASLYPEPVLSWVAGLDSRGRTALRGGIIIVHTTSQTQERLSRWASCPTSNRYPRWRGLIDDWPAEQGAFNEYIRYDFSQRVREIPCNEAHGYLGTVSLSAVMVHCFAITHWGKCWYRSGRICI
jgi:hypothetical protein